MENDLVKCHKCGDKKMACELKTHIVRNICIKICSHCKILQEAEDDFRRTERERYKQQLSQNFRKELLDF